MHQTMALFFRPGDLLRGWFDVVIFAAFVGGAIVARYWRFLVQRWNGRRGRDWQTVSAVVDVVSVIQQTEQTRYGERVTGYLATLTYFYRNPELQTGDYSRLFDTEDEAQEWAASYKGNSVIVHVDPRNPSISVLRKEELS